MSIEVKRKKLELSRVQVAREEQEFKIAERQEEIARLEAMIEIQKAKEEQLKQEISEMDKGEQK